MVDWVTIVETVATSVGGSAAVAAFAWNKVGRKAAERHADELFMHGSVEVPGVRPAVLGAAMRLSAVEKGVATVSRKVDLVGEHLTNQDQKLEELRAQLTMKNGHTIAEAIEGLATDKDQK